ncbi:hypothetical protein KSE_52495 [Kitasatospora setae KM-6054]|uniref:Uncharacterized protein n=1 Tax=Kitasatospora setae (strain ATCC 33774 / DSM 43861 / JCM 3304 / KCC A-0304 / NBRC 14216 / KM-6054) TaxID=452652 RepID=E4NHP5_KITSK|nr:hypothetical protein KSE_52495 [Kitasatospora setae KM-6054]
MSGHLPGRNLRERAAERPVPARPEPRSAGIEISSGSDQRIRRRKDRAFGRPLRRGLVATSEQVEGLGCSHPGSSRQRCDIGPNHRIRVPVQVVDQHSQRPIVQNQPPKQQMGEKPRLIGLEAGRQVRCACALHRTPEFVELQVRGRDRPASDLPGLPRLHVHPLMNHQVDMQVRCGGPQPGSGRPAEVRHRQTLRRCPWCQVGL